MFNALSAGELSSALSVLLREVAGRQGHPSPFERAQLSAGATVAKYLAAELEHGPAVVTWLREELTAQLVDAGLVEASEQTRASRDVNDLAEALSSLFSDSDAAAVALRPRLHALLREFSEREMEVLSHAV